MAGFTLEENFVSIASLSFTFLEALVAIVFAFVVCRKLPSVEKWIITWLVYDVLTHFTLVGWYMVSPSSPGGFDFSSAPLPVTKDCSNPNRQFFRRSLKNEIQKG